MTGLAPFVPTENFSIDSGALSAFLKKADYVSFYPHYYRSNLAEKSLEHFITLQFLQPTPADIFIDVASEGSPLPDIVTRLFRTTSYAQDIMYPAGISGRRIGGDACEMPVPDGFATKVALTCSLEHFEGNGDSRLFHEIARILRPGGKVAVAPLYIFNKSVTLTDPRYSATVEVPFDSDTEIYCAEGYCNRHGRFYSPQTLFERIVNPIKQFCFTVYRIAGREHAPGDTYITFALVGKKI
jgi:SAM-dependent methyltransferase